MGKIQTLDNFLGGKLRIYQFKEGYRAGHDSVLLASSIKAREGDLCLELGFGTGVVSLCLAKRVPNIKIIGFENDSEMLKISKKNIKLNNFNKSIKVFNIDVEEKIENSKYHFSLHKNSGAFRGAGQKNHQKVENLLKFSGNFPDRTRHLG